MRTCALMAGTALMLASALATAANCPASLPKTAGPDDVTCTCTPQLAQGGRVIGGPGGYAAGSSICRAAVYQGDLTEDGGDITYRADRSFGSSLRAGRPRNGITPVDGPAETQGLTIYRIP